MTDPIISGIGLGLVLAMMVGPVFFALIQLSIDKGFVAAVLMALGVVVSDAIYILFAWFGSNLLDQNVYFEKGFGLMGGLLLIVFGVASILKKRPGALNKPVAHIPRHLPFRYFSKGFLLNSLNPFVFLFWLGVIGYVSLKESYDQLQVLVFFATTLGTIFSTDLLKAFVADKIRHYIKPNMLLWLNRIAGVALAVFGFKLLWQVF